MNAVNGPIAPWTPRTCDECHGSGLAYTGTRQHTCHACNGQTTQVWNGKDWVSPQQAGKAFYAMMTAPINRRIERPRSYRRF
jgi:hypothetical protein